MRMNALLLAALIGCDGDDTGKAADADKDGFVSSDDCDDDDAAVNPDAAEVCDGIDNDCDGVADNAADGLSTFYRDADGDGYGNSLSTRDACAAPDGYVDDSADCNDGSADIYPGAAEVCDDLDNDCDGTIDVGAADAPAWYTDADSDGYGDPKTGQASCDAISGAVTEGGDCDDADRTVSPGADERCDGVDNNCDGAVDEDGAVDGTVYYSDDDNDGYGEPETGVRACGPPSIGVVTNGYDCDDTNAEVNPIADEVCDDLDNNCDEQIDEGVTQTFYGDSDGDGYGYADGKSEVEGCEAPTGYTALDGDCDDSDDSIHPGALDFFNDGVVPDCDGIDGNTRDIEGAEVSVLGFDGGLVGHSVEICDVDGDLQADLIVARPFDPSGSYTGGALVYFGISYASWTTGMGEKEADTVIDASGQFDGFGLACGDFNGDGYDDLAIGRGEINYGTTYQTNFEILIFEGDSSGWGSALSESDAMGSVVYDMGAPAETPTVYSPPFWAGDTDGDGYSELIVDANDSDGALTIADGDLWVLDVSALIFREEDMADYVVETITPDAENAVSSFAVVADYSGDSVPDIVIGQNGYYSEDDEITSGLLSWLPGVGTDEIAELESASLEGPEDLSGMGGDFAIGDFDGDGLDDLIVSAYGMDSAALADVGGLYAYSDMASALTGSYLDAAASADAYTEGVTEGGALGYHLFPISDLDGDGSPEVLVLERGGDGMLYVASGAAVMSSGGTIDDVKLLEWEGPGDEIFGFDLDAGDMDGDGVSDWVISGISYTSGATNYYDGSAWVILSSSLGL